MIKNEKISKGTIAWMASRSVPANLLMAIFLIGGFIFTQKIKKEVFPDFDLDRIMINVSYPGASPEEVEQGIILSIEESIQGIEGIKDIESRASEGQATVTIEILDGEDNAQVLRDIQNEVERISSFPDDAEVPKVYLAARKRAVMSLVLYGQQEERVLRAVVEDIRDQLLQDEDITLVELVGAREYEISIEIKQETLRKYNLTLDQVAKRIRETAIDLPGGSLKTKSGDILVRMKERRDQAHEFGKIPIISMQSGSIVLLEDIAIIKEGFEETNYFGTYNGMPAVRLDVYRVGDQTPISVADAIKRQIETINKELPPGLFLAKRTDRSKIFTQRLELLIKNGLMGLLLVFIMLALFLEMRLAFWVSMGIPISFLGSLLILPQVGLSINMISMFAFIVTLGIVVDDAIVVGESVYQYRQDGFSWHEASIKGTLDISMPVTFSVLTNMVAFLPMFFVPGFLGKIFINIPIVVISVFAISLIESLFVLPAHLGHQANREKKGIFSIIGHQQQRFSHFFIRMVHKYYKPLLNFTLRNRYITLCICISILMLTIGYVKSGRMGFELFPKVESDYAKVSATLPYGVPVQKTIAVQDILVKSAQVIAEKNGGKTLVEGIFSQINENETSILVYLTSPDERPISTAEFTTQWRKQTGNISGLEFIKFESDAGGPGSGSSLSVELSHRNMEVLKSACADLAEALDQYPNVSDIDDGFQPGKKQIDFQIRPEGNNAGLRPYEVARQIRYAYYGAEALRQQRGRNEVKVKVRLPLEERSSEYYLEEMIIKTPQGVEMPLRDAVWFKRGHAYTKIERKNGRRVVTVNADVRPRSRTAIVLNALKQEVLPQIVKKYSGLTYSFEGRQADQRESMQSLIVGLLFALLVIYAMLAIPFNSYIQPFIVIMAVPFGIVGAIWGHLLMGYSLCVISMFGVVALSGVVINDSLVFIDLANRKYKKGLSRHDSIIAAGLQRFRPILLTTLTTFGGLAPMIFETSRQARFLIPMAISLGFGIVFATGITLILIPCLYLIFDDLLLSFYSGFEISEEKNF
ncbi:cobalt-zinc-cadmium resistance protein [Candidatus Magnetomorum sp. HK-1]|nr:cobalt-zinc-cadmium resistance protein [Candidatus Magnetomorum sp. HK-1]